jgi:uncharacterized DUF497 family protein
MEPFEWDETKAQRNLIKHGVSFAEAATVFEDLNAVTIEDTEHSFQELRYIDIGLSESAPTPSRLLHRTRNPHPHHQCTPLYH